MKLHNPKTSVAFNVLSIFGWVSAFLFIHFMPYGYEQQHPSGSDDGSWFLWLLLIGVTIGFICISYFIHVIELVFDFKINNKFITDNYIYSYFIEFGLCLYTFPIIWFEAFYDYTLLPILYLILSYIILKVVIITLSKLINKIKSKKNISNDQY